MPTPPASSADHHDAAPDDARSSAPGAPGGHHRRRGRRHVCGHPAAAPRRVGPIIVLERSGHVSYANCGLPYFVGGVIEDEDDLLLQTPQKLHDRFRLDVRVDSEVVDIDAAGHTLTVRSTLDGSTAVVPFDKLVLSPGAVSVVPPSRGSTGCARCGPSRTPSAWPATSPPDPHGRGHRGRLHRPRDRREPAPPAST